MTPRVLFFRNKTPLDVLLFEGFKRYCQRHNLTWQLEAMDGNKFGRCEYLRDTHTGPLAIVGMLTKAALAEFREVFAERPVSYLASRPLEGRDVSVVRGDDVAIAEHAVGHLLAQGYEAIATWGCWTFPYKLARYEAAERYCLRRGIPFYRLEWGVYPEWRTGEEVMQGLLAELPKPLGIFAHQDEPALFAMNFCRRNNVRVPDDVGIVGVDDVPGQIMEPITLSSVRIPWRQIGEELARTFHRQVSGGALGGQELVLPSYGVSSRASTRRVGCRHSLVLKKFLKLVQADSHKGLTVAGCAKKLQLNRSTLYRQVKEETGVTPQVHLRDARLAHACTLLQDTDLPISKIAAASGFQSRQRFHAAFCQRYPVPPSQWRHR